MRVLLLSVFCACAGVQAAHGAAKPVLTPAAAHRSTLQSLTAAGPVVLRGRLAEAQVQVNLHPKEDVADGIEGNYFVFGRSAKILVAGEVEADELALEESENGTDVSGQWNGTFDGKTLSGTWQSADGTVTKPFELMPVRPNGKALPGQLKTGKDSK